MKIGISVLTFLIVFSINNFAEGASPEYVVRAIYFLPKDLEPTPNAEAEFDKLLKDAQQFTQTKWNATDLAERPSDLKLIEQER